MPRDQVPTDHNTTSQREQRTRAEHEPPRPPGPLSQSDPEPERSTGRAPVWLVVLIVLLVTGFVILHVTGVFGPGAH